MRRIEVIRAIAPLVTPEDLLTTSLGATMDDWWNHQPADNALFVGTLGSVTTTALGMAAIAPNGPVLGLALFAMGIGGAVIWIPAPAISARALPPERAGMAVGMVGSGIGAGIVFAGTMASVIGDDADGWQRVYRIEFVIAVCVLLGVFAGFRCASGRGPGNQGRGIPVG